MGLRNGFSDKAGKVVMPSASYAGIVEFALLLDGWGGFLKLEKGDKIIDIGCGIGRLGFVIRDLTDYKWGNFSKDSFELNLIGVDIWEPYLKETQKALYSELVCAEALDFLKGLHAKKGTCKLIVLSHILEHMTRDYGWESLSLARNLANYVIIILPLVDSPQEPVFGNKLEAHISEWTLNELARISKFFQVRGDGNYPNGVFLIEGVSDD